MALFQFKSNGKIKKLVDLVYPVGSIYISTSATNPGTLFGGTWEQFAQGRTLIGAGTGNDGSTSMSFTSQSEGGRYREKIDYYEQYPHRHNTTVGNQSGGNKKGLVYSDDLSETWMSVDDSLKTSYNLGTNEQQQPISKIQPYIVVIMWKRIS